MAQVSFEIKYYFDANGLEWEDISENELTNIMRDCENSIWLNFKEKIKPDIVEINNIDNYTELPAKALEAGCDCFAEILLTFDVDDAILEELGVEILDESESYSGDLDSLFGEGVFGHTKEILIDYPEQIWVE